MTEEIVLTFAELQTKSFTNSPDLPLHIKFQVKKKWYYREWVGIGWIECEPQEDAVLVID